MSDRTDQRENIVASLKGFPVLPLAAAARRNKIKEGNLP